MIRISTIAILNNILLFFDAESLIRYGGLLIVCLIVYANTGLFFCFFLPSGAVLFTAGVFAATGGLPQNIFVICLLLIFSSVIGSITGYAFGKKTGPALYRRRDSKFFRRQYLTSTEIFYKKHGALTCIAGYFLPIIRTFAPVVAGMINLDFRRFILLSWDQEDQNHIYAHPFPGQFANQVPIQDRHRSRWLPTNPTGENQNFFRR